MEAATVIEAAAWQTILSLRVRIRYVEREEGKKKRRGRTEGCERDSYVRARSYGIV